MRLALWLCLILSVSSSFAITPWEVLGLSPGASEDQIKKAYRRLARENHPDVTGNDAAKTERFKAVANAYEQLTENAGRWQSGGGEGGRRESPFTWNETGGENPRVEAWLAHLQAAYRQSNARRAGGDAAASPIADSIRSAFGRIGGEVNVTGRYFDVLKGLGQDGNLLEAVRIFLRRNLPHYLENNPTAGELNEIGRAAFNAAFGRTMEGDPAWNRFSKTMAWLMRESQEIAKTESEFTEAVRYEFSHEPFPGTSLGDPNRKAVLTKAEGLLWDRSALYAARTGKPREELLVQLLETLPPDYQSKNGMLAGAILSMASGQYLDGFKRPDITDAISPEGKLRMAILIRDLTARQNALPKPGYRLGNAGERAEGLIRELTAKFPRLAGLYGSRLGARGWLGTFVCTRVLKQLPGLPPTSQRQSPPAISGPDTPRLPY